MVDLRADYLSREMSSTAIAFFIRRAAVVIAPLKSRPSRAPLSPNPTPCQTRSSKAPNPQISQTTSPDLSHTTMRGRPCWHRWRSHLSQAYDKKPSNLLAPPQLTRSLASLTLQKPAEETITTSTTSLELWTWGRGEAGQLGLGKESTERSPSLLESLPHKFRLASMPGVLPSSSTRPNGGVEDVGISCGLFHSCFWKNGELWLWGKGDGGRLGSGSEVSLYSPHLNPHLSHVTSVALGGLHSAAVTADGDVFTFGFGGFGALGHGSYEKVLRPKLVDGSAAGMKNVVHIACGGAHTAAVSASGSVYTWGRDEGEGRLGYIPGPAYEDGTCVPERVRGIPDSIAAVACGGFFTMALTSAGQLWSWGGNSNFELGTGDRRPRWRPRVVPEVESTRLIQVACGGYHSAALTEDGKVLTWGHGGHGQLGHGNLANTKTPKAVEALEGQRAVSVACGGAWTTAVTEAGDLYTWGKNRDCQLGVSGLMDTEMLPVLVSLTAEDEEASKLSRRAIAVASGAHHGMCLVICS